MTTNELTALVDALCVLHCGRDDETAARYQEAHQLIAKKATEVHLLRRLESAQGALEKFRASKTEQNK